MLVKVNFQKIDMCDAKNSMSLLRRNGGEESLIKLGVG